jgi:hypothetical protein
MSGTAAPRPTLDEERREKRERRMELHDFASTVLLSLATLLTAWSAFQATAWADDQSQAGDDAEEALLESTRADSAAATYRIADVVLWNQWINDVNAERDADPSLPPPGPDYVPTPGSRSEATVRRFRREFVPAFESWLESDPFVDPTAPPVPFVDPHYVLTQDKEAERRVAEAERLRAISDDAEDTARQYVALAVAYAAVLGLSAIGVKLRTTRSRDITLTVAGSVFVAITVVMFTLPVDL